MTDETRSESKGSSSAPGEISSEGARQDSRLTGSSTTVSRTSTCTSAGFLFVLWLLSSFTFILIIYNSGEQRWYSDTSPLPLTRHPAQPRHQFNIKIHEFWGELWPTGFAIILTNIDRFVWSPALSVVGFFGWIVSKELYSAADRFNTSMEFAVLIFAFIAFIYLVSVIGTLMLLSREVKVLEMRNHREANQA